MTEGTAPKSSPELQKDESDDSMNITANEDESPSKQATDEVPIATTSKNESHSDTTCRGINEPQTSTERGLFGRHLFYDKDDDGSNDPYDLLRFSDNDLAKNDGSTSSGNSESNHEADVNNDDLFSTTIVCNKTGRKKRITIKNVTGFMKEFQKTMNTSSSDEEADCVLSQLVSNVGGETSKTKDTSVGPEKEEQDLSSSDEETNYILSQIKATIHYGGESSKTNYVSEKKENELSFSDEDTNDSNEQTTFNEGGESSKTTDSLAGPSKEKNEKPSDEAAKDIPSHAKSNARNESMETEVVTAGPSNAGQDQIKPPTRNKAERKINYTLPFKKFKKF